MFQPDAVTSPNRYPRILTAAREHLPDGPAIRLLSFGCADGDEVFSLREYFPAAHIRGIDISAQNIRRAARRLSARGGDEHIEFVRSHTARVQDAGTYDAVFAMAVFRHTDLDWAAESSEPSIRFADVAVEVQALADLLREGGLFAFRHSHFRFTDFPASTAFECLLASPERPDAPVYGADNRLIGLGGQVEGLWKKRSRQGSAG